MPTDTGQPDQKLWYHTSFAFPSTDRCCCYRHKTRSGRNKRCHRRQSVIGLTDPESPDRTMRTFCLDCWLACRSERTQPDPAQTAMYRQMRKDDLTPTAMGC